MEHASAPPRFDRVLRGAERMIRAIVSDLGNVLLHFDHRLITSRLAGHLPGAGWTEEQERSFWPLVRDFEHGSIGSDNFLQRAGDVLALPSSLDREQFRRLWADIFWPNEEFIALLAGLRERLRLVMLSNTNPLHIEFARERFPELFSLFDDAVYSYEVSASKPDPAIYRAALAKAGAEAGETLYFDDIAAYVDAASALGMHAYQYVSIAGARDVLRMYDLMTEK
jgi:glucose-1-phosphatase